jgi:hypothetical protein
MKPIILLILILSTSCSKRTEEQTKETYKPQDILNVCLEEHSHSLTQIKEATNLERLTEASSQAHRVRQKLLSELSRISYRKELSPTEQQNWYEELKKAASTEEVEISSTFKRLEKDQ